MTICLRASGDTPALYFYGELDAQARSDFERHLASCAACAAAVSDLEQVRDALGERGAAATRTDREWTGFMERLDASIQGATQGAQGKRKKEKGKRPAVLLLVAATLLVGIALGVLWQQRSPAPGPTPQTAAIESPGDAPLEAAAARHFERAKLVVLGLAMKDAASASAEDWEYERALAASLLPETRLFRLSAADRGDARLARLLGDLETVLLQASMTSDAETPELRRLQRIIRGRDLIVRMGFREL